MSLASELHDLFVERNYTWNMKDGSQRLPTVEEMQQTLDSIKEKMDTLGEGTVMSVGRLLANKQPQGLEIYLYLGDYDGTV